MVTHLDENMLHHTHLQADCLERAAGTGQQEHHCIGAT